MEVVGFTLGVLASVEQVITTVEALKDRYVAFRQNTHHIARLLTSYQSFAGDLRAMDDQFRGKLCDVAPPNRRIFERHMREMVESFDSARNTLDQTSSKLSRGRVLRFLRAKSQAEVCNELLSELRRVEGLLFDMNSFLATADVIDSVKQEIRAGGEADQFRPSFPVVTAAPDLVLDFDSVDTNGNPNTIEAKVKQLILNGDSNSEVFALQGMGGVGKSSVLRQLALDIDVRRQYSEGVHIITLGVDATPSTAIRELLNAVSRSGGIAIAKKLQLDSDLDSVILGVLGWFQSRKCLFLIDDLWSTNRLGASFLAKVSGLADSGRRNCILVTTRDLEIASQGHVIAMTPHEALSESSKTIMMRYAKANEDEIRDEETRKNISELLRISGGLPVSLAIVGKGVRMLFLSYGERKSIAWEKYLRTLRVCREDLMRRAVGRYPNLSATFSASITLLEESRHTMPVPTSKSFPEMHTALCVLKKQGSAPISMLRLLWNLQKDQHAAFIAREFARVGLAAVSLEAIGNEYHEFLYLHDIIHDFSISQAEPKVSSFHDELLNAYSIYGELSRVSERSFFAWWLPPLMADYYIHENLCRHLRLAGREAELLDLLIRPEWLDRQLNITGFAQIEEDFLEGIAGLHNVTSRDITEKDLKYIAGAVRLSTMFLSQNPSELSFQLVARLIDKAASSVVLHDYLKRVESIAVTPWLRPLVGCLAASGGPLKAIVSVNDPLASLCLSNDRNQALCGSDGGSVYVIHLGRDYVFSKWKAHDAVVSSISISTDDSKVVTGSWDTTAKVWDLSTKTCLATFTLHQNVINSVKLTSDNETALSASADDTVKGWKISNPEEELFSFKEHSALVLSVTASPDGRYAFSGGNDQEVLMWPIIEFGQVWKRFPYHTHWVRSLAVSADGTQLATGSGSIIRVWNLDSLSKEPLKVLEATAGIVRALSLSADGSRLASGYDDNSVRIWDLQRGEQLGGDLISHSESVTGVSLSADGSTAISCSWDGSVRVWDLSDLWYWRSQRTAHYSGVTCLSLSSDGHQLVSGSKDRAIKVWDVSSGRQTDEEYSQAHSDDISGVAITQNGQRIVSTSVDRTLRVWDRHTRKELATATGHERNISCSAISADGKKAYTGSYDLTIRIWDLTKNDGSPKILRGHTHWIRRLYMSEDGEKIISASSAEVRVWNIQRRECVRFVQLKDADALSQEDLFVAVGERYVRRTNIDIPLKGRQILWKEDSENKVLGTLEADVIDWCFSEALQTVCVGLSSGQVSFFRLNQ